VKSLRTFAALAALLVAGSWADMARADHGVVVQSSARAVARTRVVRTRTVQRSRVVREVQPVVVQQVHPVAVQRVVVQQVQPVVVQQVHSYFVPQSVVYSQRVLSQAACCH
jgi:hypothetical protein